MVKFPDVLGSTTYICHLQEQCRNSWKKNKWHSYRSHSIRHTSKSVTSGCSLNQKLSFEVNVLQQSTTSNTVQHPAWVQYRRIFSVRAAAQDKPLGASVCVCVRACVRACVCARARLVYYEHRDVGDSKHKIQYSNTDKKLLNDDY
jgi:hypothetical protein